MIRIEHIALWTQQLEEMKTFYEKFFDASASPRYFNPAKGFESYFLSFSSGARLEIMRSSRLMVQADTGNPRQGYAHFALALGHKDLVDAKTEELSAAGFTRIDGPRTTGDGYYESTFLDPDGNVLELTV